ncbi:MAG: Ig-like domain-containing protein [Bradymonadia bacterium]
MHLNLSTRFAPLKTPLIPVFMLFCGAFSGCVVGVDDASKSLHVIEIEPVEGANAPVDQPLRITFDRYLDPDQDFSRAADVISGGLRVGASVGYDPVAPGLVVVPTADLPPGIGYTLVVRAERIRALDGGQMAEDVRHSFIGARSTTGPRETPLVDFESEVAPILEARCGGCHGPDLPPEMTEAGLVGVQSPSMPELLMVRPGQPMESTLVLKLLPDYPRRVGQQMPLSGDLLDPETLRTLVSWVAQL